MAATFLPKPGQTVRLPDGRCAILAFHDGRTARVLIEGERRWIALDLLRPVSDSMLPAAITEED